MAEVLGLWLYGWGWFDVGSGLVLSCVSVGVRIRFSVMMKYAGMFWLIWLELAWAGCVAMCWLGYMIVIALG